MSKFRLQPVGATAIRLLTAGLAAAFACASGAAAPPTVPISQSPITAAVPAHPQVMFAVGNSESMDGNLSGAIMTGSGSLSATSLLALQNSSSPLCFTIPAGFTPMVSGFGSGTGGCPAGQAPYTVTVGSNLVDNSPSRLNVAKQGIQAILQAYLPSVDFALEDYSTSGTTLYNTWVYYMSPTGGSSSADNFQYTNTASTGSNPTITNPCAGYTTLAATSSTVKSNCGSISTGGDSFGGTVSNSLLQVSNSSDNPLINDVLYSSGLQPIFVTYSGPSPANPYSNYTLAQYNSNPGSINESYNSSAPNLGSFGTTPTNAGFVPFTQQVMYVERGFGYGGSQSSSTGSTVVTLKSAGQPPTSNGLSNALAAFSNALSPETNATGTNEIKASAGQSDLAAVLAGSLNYLTNPQPASSNSCKPTQAVVLTTDGLPTLDLSGNSWPPLGTISAQAPPNGFGVYATYNTDGSITSTTASSTNNDQALLDTITKLQSLNSTTTGTTAHAPIKTYIVGLGAGVNPANNPAAASALKAMAIAGGTSNYYPATSPGALVTDLQSILGSIIGTAQSTAATAVNSTGLNTGTDVFQASFSTEDTFQDWTGDVGDYSVNPTSQTVNTPALWSAQAHLDAQVASGGASGRIIAIWQSATASAIPFEWSTSSASSSTSGITATSALGTTLTSTTLVPVASDSSGPDRLNYLRGDSSKELRNGGTFRDRSHLLGDIVDSNPIYVGAPNGFYQSASYAAFQAAQANRKPVLYVGSNDGMLHAFDATPGTPLGSTPPTTSGNELFAFIPNAVFPNMPTLTSTLYNGQHRFFVDGSPTSGDVQFSDNSWHTMLIGSEAAGGNTVFALDVTNPGSLTTESALAAAALWEFTDTDMGNSYSYPNISSINASPGYAVFFGNGYNSPNNKAILYAVNLQTGATIAKIDLCAQVTTACNSSLANGLSSVEVVNSAGALSAPSDTVYAGDLQGNLWRINISSSTVSSWSVSVLFQARDGSGNPQPITVTPSVALNPQYPQRLGTMVYFGTGQLLGIPDLGTTQTQTIYGIYDAGGTPAASPYTRSNLQAQTLSPSGNFFVSSSNAVNLNTVKGWYVDLSGAGQSGLRSVTNPEVIPGGELLLTVYAPNTNVCTGGGTSDLLLLNSATGGAFTQPTFQAPSCTSIAACTASGQAPTGYLMGSGFVNTPSVVSTSINGGGGLLGISSLGPGSLPTTPIRPVGKSRTAWWEIQ